MTSVQRAGETLTVNSKIVMWHVVLQVDHDREAAGVAITTNPLEFDAAKFMAQVVMYKTRGHSTAVQVARYVRRHHGVVPPVSTHKANRVVEAKIGYACTTTAQHAPNERTPGWGTFQHIAISSVQQLLDEVKGGDSAARVRYTVYEVRGAGYVARGVTNKMAALELMFRRSPPDTIKGADIVHIGMFDTMEAAREKMAGFVEFDSQRAWTRRPSHPYMSRILRITTDDGIVWVADGTTAIRRYVHGSGMPNPCVIIGPHVYTEPMLRHYLLTADWVDGRSMEGRRIRFAS